ncbi:threonine synthase, partial [Pseudomonas sp. NPDC098747]|uniref:threonine synthase n=1 Tax=Pseudomonas sp. NPDC098747 TaxID=3364487 RepID=UPI00383A4441
MRYISTRGQAPALNFEDVLLAGLATDGGLYVPEVLPRFTQEEIASWAGLPYHELAFRVMRPFVTGSIPDADFKKILEETYGVFSHSAVAPLRQLNGNEWVLELFHGPTLAFKDFALQLLGRLLDYVLEKRGERVVIVGATSGDTGSAAIEGCKHCENVDIFILHPHNRVSEVQRRQMTTIFGENIHNIAIEGNFDDCQEMVKASFADQSFLKGTRLVAVNSINWARIMAQIVYYFHASLQLGGPARSVSFSVPTGNFGDIFAGYLARNIFIDMKMLLLGKIVIEIVDLFFSGII